MDIDPIIIHFTSNINDDNDEQHQSFDPTVQGKYILIV